MTLETYYVVIGNSLLVKKENSYFLYVHTLTPTSLSSEYIAIHCWSEVFSILRQLVRFSASYIQLVRIILRKTLVHRACGRPTLILSRRSLFSRTHLELY